MNIFQVRNLNDAPAIAVLAAQTFPLACPPDTQPENIEQFIDEFLTSERFAGYIEDSTYTVLGAYDEGKPIAYSLLHADEPRSVKHDAGRSRPRLELNKFYVLPCCHGRGIAAELMNATLDAARSLGEKSIWLGVNKANERAIRFYSQCGFTTAGARTFKLGREIKHDLVMERML